MTKVYYPQVRLQTDLRDVAHPMVVAPIHDDLSATPLEAFPVGELCSAKHEHAIPIRPKGFDGYLHPTLTSNERLRLTMLWYYTRGLLEDKETLSKLQEKVELVKTFTGWEFAICGLLSNDIFQRIVSVGMPVATVPRRESPCSHTVQAAGVFYVPDMANDWRFDQSPQVCHGGLRSYAGARLQCRVDGQDVALGSLCVASDVPNKQLSQVQMDVLLKFADMLTADIVTGAQQKRALQQLHNDDLLKGHHQDVKTILKILRGAYPKAEVDIVSEAPGDTIWEDHQLIDELLRTMNHTKLRPDRPVRAVIGRVRERFLVVSTKEPSQVFDDVDIRFVKDCAAAISNIIQEESLQSALSARSRFMRGITHQLRTPIHGILGSVALLLDEGIKSESLAMIKDSGLELMSTVNNIIKFNQSIGPRTSALGDLNTLEADVLDDISWLDLQHVSIMFNNQIPGLGVTTDLASLRDCLQLLVHNALQNTTEGSVVVTISTKEFSSIIFDIEDTGCGIAEADQQRIFNAYEKCDIHAKGAGLGLTLACKIAEELDGLVSLVSSVAGKGSHFRAEFQDPGFSCLRTQSVVAHSFFVYKPCPLIKHLRKYLSVKGWTEEEDGGVVIVPLEYLDSAPKGRISISLVPTDVDPCMAVKYPDVLFFSGPFTSSRLAKILSAVDSALGRAPALIASERKTLQPISDYRPKCLLVDDNAINLRILCHFCDKRKFDYVTARDGHEAFEQYKQQRPDLILLDLQMPRRDGIQACEDIRAFEVQEALQPAKVFIITGQDSANDRQKATSAGADKFFVKPLVLKTLDRAIMNTFSERINGEAYHATNSHPD